MLIKPTFFGGFTSPRFTVRVLLVRVLLVQSSPVQSAKYSMPSYLSYYSSLIHCLEQFRYGTLKHVHDEGPVKALGLILLKYQVAVFG